MIKSIHQKTTIIAIIFALLTIVIISTAFISRTYADLQLQNTLIKNCANTRISAESEKNVLVDPESGVVRLEVSGPGESHNSIILPYSPETGFSGCSQDAKELLTRIQENQEKYTADMCTGMTAIVNGERPLPKKGGRKANIDGAIQFTKKYCNK